MTKLSRPNRDGNMRLHVGVPDGFKPFRDRPVKVRSVPCPTCKVEAGEQCLRADGKPGTQLHRKRRGLAIQEGF